MSGLEFCIIRPNGFFCDMSEFLKMAKKGVVKLFGDGHHKMNPIHGADLARLCVANIQSERKHIEVGGPQILTHKEIAELAFRTLGTTPKIKYMPNRIRSSILGLAKVFTSSRTYGPVEFFFTVLAMDMVAPRYGSHTLEEYFHEIQGSV